MSEEPRVRAASPADTPDIWRFVRLLAEYEKLQHKVTATPSDLADALFGPSPRVFADMVELDGQAVGFSLWFYNFSTFVGRAGIYVEDLFVLPGARGRGAGRALLTRLAARCLDEGLGRLHWAVLDWNAPSIAFYERLGAEALDDWRLMRVSGASLARLADQAAAAP
jgi:GNAT superfamily N-acetyltransferase